MSNNTKIFASKNSTLKNIRQTINFVLTGFNKIFSPRNDEYPVVGVQPFEGDPTKK